MQLLRLRRRKCRFIEMTSLCLPSVWFKVYVDGRFSSTAATTTREIFVGHCGTVAKINSLFT